MKEAHLPLFLKGQGGMPPSFSNAN